MADDATTDNGSDSQSARRTPPYIAYATFKTVLNNFKTLGIPPEVNRSAFPSFSGGMQNQVMLALRSLDLVDANNKPTPTLETLANAFETAEYKPLLRKLIEEKYPYVLSLDLMAITPATFAESFKNNTGAKEDVLRKCRTFFLNAAKDAEIPIGPRLEKASFPRTRSSGPRKQKAKTAAKNAKSQVDDDPTKNDRQDPESPVVQQLLEKFPPFDPTWPDEIKKQWFDGFERFMSSAGVNKTSGE